MLNIKVTEAGHLALIATPEGIEYIKDHESRDYWLIMSELFESYSCNGGYCHFDARQGDPYIGLTTSPAIAESMTYEDDRAVIEGRCWWLPDYATTDDLGLLRDGKTVVYAFGFNADD